MCLWCVLQTLKPVTPLFSPLSHQSCGPGFLKCSFPSLLPHTHKPPALSARRNIQQGNSNKQMHKLTLGWKPKITQSCSSFVYSNFFPEILAQKWEKQRSLQKEGAKAPSARNLWATVPDKMAQSKPSNISLLRSSLSKRVKEYF